MNRPGAILVAHAEAQRGIEHVVGQRDGGRHGNHIATEERQFHAALTLRDTVAHGRYAARELRHGTGFARRLFDDGGIALQRSMGRQHVVIGRDDRDIGPAAKLELLLVGGLGGGEPMGQIGAGEVRAGRLPMTAQAA